VHFLKRMTLTVMMMVLIISLFSFPSKTFSETNVTSIDSSLDETSTDNANDFPITEHSEVVTFVYSDEDIAENSSLADDKIKVKPIIVFNHVKKSVEFGVEVLEIESDDADELQVAVWLQGSDTEATKKSTKLLLASLEKKCPCGKNLIGAKGTEIYQPKRTYFYQLAVIAQMVDKRSGVFKKLIPYTVEDEHYFKTKKYLANKIAYEYPTYFHPIMQIYVKRPLSAVMPIVPKANRVKWTTTTRTKYRQWWEGLYNGGQLFPWTGIDIHHIIPKEYGGNNTYNMGNRLDDNLIPLSKPVHQKFSYFFENYT